MLQKPIDFRKNVVWFDESEFNLFGSDSKVMVCRISDEEFDPEYTILTVKHRSGSVIVWGCFIRQGVGKLYLLDRTMDSFYYRDILEQNL